MKAGRLRYTGQFQQRSSSKNTRGEFVNTWSTLATRRVALRPLAGREYWQASGEHSAVNTEIRVRYDSTLAPLNPKDRFVDTGKSPNVVYDIEAVIRPRETALELVLMCVRRSGG